jgi:hypothetical protein
MMNERISMFHPSNIPNTHSVVSISFYFFAFSHSFIDRKRQQRDHCTLPNPRERMETDPIGIPQLYLTFQPAGIVVHEAIECPQVEE